jgi:hypothetical protein
MLILARMNDNYNNNNMAGGCYGENKVNSFIHNELLHKISESFHMDAQASTLRRLNTHRNGI